MRGVGDVIIRMRLRQNATCVKMPQSGCGEVAGKSGFLKKFVMVVLAGAESGH